LEVEGVGEAGEEVEAPRRPEVLRLLELLLE
jgi:hypothetical protein